MSNWIWWPARQALGWMSSAVRTWVLGGAIVMCAVLPWLMPQAAAHPATAAVLLSVVYIWLCHALDQRRAIHGLQHAIETVASGDLSKPVQVQAAGTLGHIVGRLEKMQQTWSRLVANIRSEAQLVAMAGERLTTGARSLSSRTEEQAASLEQTAASVTQLVASVKRNAEDAGVADRLAGELRQNAEQGITVVAQAVDSVRRIEERSNRMGQIIGVIDGIAFQTNILALNAAVEAARAGESGRGFAVVAAEVRVLAQRTAQAAAEVKQLIDGSSQEVHAGVAQIQQASDLLGAMVGGVRAVAERVRQVAASNAEQSQSLGEVAQAVSSIDDLTQRNAQLVDASVQSAEKLRQQAENLKDGVISMRLRQGCADEARGLAERAAQCLKQEGLAAAAARFHDKKGPYFDRDLFVIVLDRQAILRAFGVDPNKANTPAMAPPGVDKDELNQRIFTTADEGGGWVEFTSWHPITKQPVQKMAYVVPVQALVVMVSVNKSDGGAAPAAPKTVK